MKICYGIHELREIHEHVSGIVNTDPLTTEWLSCCAFLAEAYELEVTKHGGLNAEKIEAYKAVCREFLHPEEFEQFEQ